MPTVFGPAFSTVTNNYYTHNFYFLPIIGYSFNKSVLQVVTGVNIG